MQYVERQHAVIHIRQSCLNELQFNFLLNSLLEIFCCMCNIYVEYIRRRPNAALNGLLNALATIKNSLLYIDIS